MTTLDEYQSKLEELKTAIHGLEDKLYAEEIADRLKEKFEVDLEPVADAMAEILKEINEIKARVVRLELGDKEKEDKVMAVLLSAMKKALAKYEED